MTSWSGEKKPAAKKPADKKSKAPKKGSTSASAAAPVVRANPNRYPRCLHWRQLHVLPCHTVAPVVMPSDLFRTCALTGWRARMG